MMRINELPHKLFEYVKKHEKHRVHIASFLKDFVGEFYKATMATMLDLPTVKIHGFVSKGIEERQF